MKPEFPTLERAAFGTVADFHWTQRVADLLVGTVLFVFFENKIQGIRIHDIESLSPQRLVFRFERVPDMPGEWDSIFTALEPHG